MKTRSDWGAIKWEGHPDMCGFQRKSSRQEQPRQFAPGVAAIRLPVVDDDEIAQDQEWVEVTVVGEPRRIRLHDYEEIYRIPGLYDLLFLTKLQYRSPRRVVGLLSDVLHGVEYDLRRLRALDLGAGNGLVGAELRALNVEEVIGVDIVPTAKEASERDRPGVYDDYLVANIADLSDRDETKLRDAELNCLVTVGALGFSDIPPKAFLKAIDVVQTPAWLAFNIKDDLLNEGDATGFSKLLRVLSTAAQSMLKF